MRTFTFSVQQKISLMILALMLTGTASYGAIFTATSSGNFSSSTTWAGGMVPPTTVLLDQIVIQSGVTVNLDNNLTINGVLSQLDVEGTLTTSNNSSLTVNLGTFTGTGTVVLNNVAVNAGLVFSFTGSLTANTLNAAAGFQSSADIMVNQTLNLTSGTLSLVTGGSLDLSNNGTIVISGGLLSVGVGGSVGLSGNYNVTYTGNSSVAGIELTGSGLSNVTVNVNGMSSVTLSSDVTITGTLSLANGTLMLAGYDLSINGSVAAGGSGGVSSTSSSNISINTSGGTTGTISFTGVSSAVNNLTVNVGEGNQAKIGGNVTISGTLHLSSGILNFNNANLTIGGGVTGSGSIAGNNASNITISGLGSLVTPLNFTAGGQAVNNFTISVGSGNSVTLGSDLTVNGTLNLNGSSNINLNSYTLTIGSTGTISGSGSIIGTLSDLTINSTGGISSLLITGAIDNLTINTGASSSVTLGNNLTVTGMLTLQNGSLILNNYDLTISGNVAAGGSGTISSTSSSNVVITTSSSVTGAINFSAGAYTVGDLLIGIGNSGSVNIGSDLNVSGNLNFTSGTLNIGSNALVIGTAGSISGTSSSSYIITGAGGYLAMSVTAGGSSSVNFPIGTSTYFAPANIQLNTGSPSGQVKVGVVNGVMAQGTTGTYLSATYPLVDATWHVSSSAISNLNMNLQVMWSAAMELNAFTRSAAYISHYTNANWDISAVASATAEAGGMFSLQRNGITSLSPFAVFAENSPTATEDINSGISYRIYPNPASDNITIENVIASTDVINMDIYSITGQLVASYKLTDVTSSISIKDLVNGHYFIKFYNNKMSCTKPFTKM